MEAGASHRLPNFNEFSRGVVGDISTALSIVLRSYGGRKDLVAAIAAAFAGISRTPAAQRANRANNVLIGMSQCGLFDLDANQLTELGRKLQTLPPKEREREFAKHLLLNHGGLAVLQAAKVLQARGERVSKAGLAAELRGRGFSLTTNSVDPGKMRQWLEPSGVIDSEWDIDEEALRELVGTSTESAEGWETLSHPQRALLLTLRDLAISRGGTKEPLDAAHIKQLCIARFGKNILPEDSLRRAVLDPLRDAGWIVATGKGKGRGGKIGQIAATQKLLELPVDALPNWTRSFPPEIARKLNRPLGEIYSDLESSDTHTKGIALELLSVRIMSDLGLRTVAFRERRKDTGGAEVDLVADGLGMHYSRWLVQFKNEPNSRVRVNTLAKEIGMAVLLKAHVILLVTTGKFAQSVRDQAVELAKGNTLQVILVDGATLRDYRRRGGQALVEYFTNRATDTLRWKSEQLPPIW